MADAWAERPGAEIAPPLSFEEPYEVVSIEPRTPTICELWLRPLESALEYLPGEYVLLEDRDHELSPRSYSIANAPRADGLISLLVTRVPDGQTSAWVHERLCAGDEVSVSGSYGTFVDDPTATAPALFLAAGSGLAPIRALSEAAISAGARPSLTLVFSARTEADVIDRDRFAGRQVQHPRFRFIRSLTRGAGPPPHGRIPALLPTLYRDLSGHDVFVAGAPGFVLACAVAADRLGARREASAHGGVLRRAPAVDGREPAGRRSAMSTMAPHAAPPIYTKTGDDGTTGLLFGGRLSKADPIVEVCGTLD
jgi:CDP-4-dehydro-6-deoxyglucose reductase, E3